MSLRKFVMGLVCSMTPWAVLGGGGAALAQTAATPTISSRAAGPAQAKAGATQATTRVHGTITDPDGELIPGATITLTPAKGPGITTKSGSDGTYSVSITPGTYTYVVTMPGFAAYSALNVKIPAVTSSTLDAKLQIGTQSQVVNVEANAIQLSVDPESNQSATILQGKDLEALSDDPDELSSELTALAGPSAGPNGGQIYVDGFTGGQLPPKSSIREIRINQNPFSAQYDQLGYGRIEIFTKPGTDKLHGNFQMNGNPSQFNSADPLATGYQPPYHTIFMFGNLTGPLNKNASYNLGGSYRQIQEDEFTNATILALPGSTTLCSPGELGCVSSPFQQSVYFPQVRADFSPRLDLALGEKNVLTMRYHLVKNNATNDGVGDLKLSTAAYNSSTTSNIFQLSDTQTYSTRFINEDRFEYEREHVQDTALNSSPSVGVSGDFTAGGYSGQNLSDHQDHYEVQNYTSIQLKKNFIRVGGRLRVTREAEDTENNTNGSFTYCGLTASSTCANSYYAAGIPKQFSITQVNNHDIGDTYADLGLYAETDWKARQNLTISYGGRYEIQNHLSDRHDVAPRVSFNYGLFSGHGAPKTVLRGGFGMFYTRFSQGNILTLEQENGANETVYTVEKNLTSACSPAAVNGSGSPLANLIAACNATPTEQTTYSAAPNLRAPYIVEFAVGGDQQVSRYGTISINYLHSQGVHQFATQNIGYNFANPALTTPNYQYFSEGVFKQNQLIVNGRIQMSNRVSLFGYYSLNSAHGDTSGANSEISTPGNIAADYGRTAFDVRNRLFMAGSISLPKFIQFSPFMIAQSGNPYNITTGNDEYGDTFFVNRPAFAAPNGIQAGTPGTNTIAGCGSFAAPTIPAAGYITPGSYTPVPINYCTGPSLFTFNFRLTKTFGFGASTAPPSSNHGGGGPGGIGGPPGGHDHDHSHGGFGLTSTGKRYNLGFGLQVQNLFNNEDLSTPQGSLASANFGKSTQLADGAYTTESALRRITLQATFSF